MGEKCQCNVSVVWAEGTGNLPPTNLPPQTALGVTCVDVQKEKKIFLKNISCMNFYNPCPQSVAPKTKLKKPGLKLANLPQMFYKRI